MGSSLVTEDQMQVLSVFLGGHTFGIPVTGIQDVIRNLKLTRVPMAPPHIAGVSNLRGHIVTAINLNTRIFREKSDISESMNVVIERGGELYSMLVDRVGDVLTLEKGDVEDPPLTLSESLRDVAHGVYQLEDSIMVILDCEYIINKVPMEGVKDHEIVSHS